MRRLLISLVAVATVAVGLSAAYAAGAMPWHAVAAPAAPHRVAPRQNTFSCTTGSFFQTVNGRLSTSTNLTTWHTVGSAQATVDALAYSPASQYLYAIEVSSGVYPDQLVQINSHGNETVLGSITGLPLTNHYNGGDIDSATNTFYVSPGGTKLYAINLSTLTAAPVAVPARVTLGDDFIVQQEWLWSVTRTGVSGFSLVTGATKSFNLPGADLGDVVGAMWSDVAGDGLYFRWDNTGRTFHATGLRATGLTVHAVGTTPVAGKTNDGATCNAVTSPGPDTAPVLGVSGSSLTGLGPGKLLRVDLSLTNTYPSPVTVWPRVIKITLTDSSSSCPASSNFAVDQGVSVAFTVPANSTKTLAQLGIPTADWPLLTMLDTAQNQNACLGTTLTANYYIRYYG